MEYTDDDYEEVTKEFYEEKEIEGHLSPPANRIKPISAI